MRVLLPSLLARARKEGRLPGRDPASVAGDKAMLFIELSVLDASVLEACGAMPD